VVRGNKEDRENRDFASPLSLFSSVQFMEHLECIPTALHCYMYLLYPSFLIFICSAVCPMTTLHVISAPDPYQQYRHFRASRLPGGEDALLLVPFTLRQSWSDHEPVELVGIYYFSDGQVQYSVAPNQSDTLTFWNSPHDDLARVLTSWLARQRLPLFTQGRPLPLAVVHIPKPWGEEIWYTGVERRGVANFGTDEARVPIPHLLAVMPSVLGSSKSDELVLLKVLNPMPEPVFGDLYFELHREKQEVYVVTHIDRRAWPDGVGRMRLGFDPNAIRRAGSMEAFRGQFLQRVLDYRQIRREIDGLLDEKRDQHEIGRNAAVPVDLLKEWLRELPCDLSAREQVVRAAMEAYYGSLTLRPGDVVQVPLDVPHSLQHGVRTIEFQTPVYERQIIAFCQKVLTQDDWDTRRAVEVMEITGPSRPTLPRINGRGEETEPEGPPSQDGRADLEGIVVEQVVLFSDFQVLRITLPPTCGYLVQSDRYSLLIVLQGNVTAGDVEVTEEQALLLPATRAGLRIRSGRERPPLSKVMFLLASPR
jgi:hypothetical protein